MASGFFALFDDIATLMDDVAVMSKTAAKKTAGILGDDLAVNANKAAGFSPSCELPVLWEITKGSFFNKLILLPLAFLLSAFAPQAIKPILLLGGIYLAYEGAEKLFEWMGWVDHHSEKSASAEVSKDPVEAERKKVKSAIFTDFILSIEIIIIALGAVSDSPLSVQIPVVTFVAFLATIGVYGFVALIIRLDDIGYRIMRLDDGDGKGSAIVIGKALVASLPWIVRGLSILGTFAMFLVAGGIFLHNLPILHHWMEALPGIMAELLIGMAIGSVATMTMEMIGKLRG